MDHVNIKLYATPDSRVNWPDLIPVFHRWIRENTLSGTLIDVADYAHVPEGPGILLIGHDAFYSVDNRTDRPGFLYNRRAAAEGSDSVKLRDAYTAAVNAARKLEKDPGIHQLRFDEKRFEVFINDRALAANNADAAQQLSAAIEDLYMERFGEKPRIERESEDPRSLLRLQVMPAE